MEEKDNTLTEEEVFINLKIMSYIQVNEKIKSDGKNLVIDNRFFQGIVRWFTSDTRLKTINIIEHIISNAIKHINDRNSPSFTYFK